MSLPMTAPTRHPKTGIYRLRVAIPARLRGTTARLFDRRAEFMENLGTREPAEAKRRAPDALARINAKLASAETAFACGAGMPPTDDQVAAMAARWMAREEAAYGGTPGDPGSWDATLDLLADQIGEPDDEGGTDREVTTSKADQADATALLAEHDLSTDPTSVERVAQAVFAARWTFTSTMKQRAQGDTPAPAKTGRQAADKATPGCTFDTLLSGWALDRGWRLDMKPIPGPLYERRRTMERFAAFLGHRDASAVTKADAVRFKEDMQGRGRHASTVRNDLSELSAIWTHGMRNGKLATATNPFGGVSPPKAKKKAREPRAFTDAEAVMILQATRDQPGALRWLPWILCLTGARLGEICQSAREDVSTVDGVPVIRLHDDGEGRTLKNEDSKRTVPLHPALVAEGFLQYVGGLPARAALFPDLPVDGVFGRRSVAASKRLGRWLRGLGVTDAQISPAHSWRHWFIGAARRVTMPPEVRSAITGHSAKIDESAGYGDGMKTFIAVLAENIAKVRPPIPVAIQIDATRGGPGVPEPGPDDRRRRRRRLPPQSDSATVVALVTPE